MTRSLSAPNTVPLQRKQFNPQGRIGQPLAVLAPICKAKALTFLVCMYTVPGPVNRHARPSPELRPEMIPPEATRSILYLQFHATRWPLSM